MGTSRTEKALRNSAISIIAHFIILVLGFINRKAFVSFLNIEYLGYDNLFANIFNLLDVTELGIGGIIAFHIYKALANDNHEEISKLMYLYKCVYNIVAVVVLFLGIIIFFFLPYIIKDGDLNWSFVHKIYLIQLSGVVIGYLLSYVRTLFNSDQMEYKTVIIDLISSLLIQILQLIAIIYFRNYLLYVIIRLFKDIIANIIIYIWTYKYYPYLKKIKIHVTKDYIQKLSLVKDVKNLLVHRLAYAVYGGTDNIVISVICGIKNVALYANYYMIVNQVNSLVLYKFLNPIRASIGNYVYTEKDFSKQHKTFYLLDTVCVWIASYAMAGYVLFFQPVIRIWLGSEFLLSYTFVLLFSFTSYLGISCEMLWKYRCTFGHYEKDRVYMIISAILNLTISVVLAKRWGLIGIQIGTIFGLCAIFYGRLKVVFEDLLLLSKKQYIIKHFCYFILEVIECSIMIFGAVFIGKGIVNIIVRIFLFITIPTLMNFLYFRKTDEFLSIKEYFFNLISKVRRKRVK